MLLIVGKFSFILSAVGIANLAVACLFSVQKVAPIHGILVGQDSVPMLLVGEVFAHVSLASGCVLAVSLFLAITEDTLVHCIVPH